MLTGSEEYIKDFSNIKKQIWKKNTVLALFKRRISALNLIIEYGLISWYQHIKICFYPYNKKPVKEIGWRVIGPKSPKSGSSCC